MPESNTRPYITMFQGKERLVEAKSREAVRDHLLAEISPPLASIRIAKAAEVGMLMAGGLPYEKAGEAEAKTGFLEFEELEDSMILHALVDLGGDTDWTGIVSLIAVDGGFQLENTDYRVMEDGRQEFPVKLRHLNDEERKTFLALPEK